MSISKTEEKFYRLYKIPKFNIGISDDKILKLFILWNKEDGDEIYENWENINEFKDWLFDKYIYSFTLELREKVQELLGV